MSYISFEEGRGGKADLYKNISFQNPVYSPDFSCATCLRSAAMFRVVLGVKEKVCVAVLGSGYRWAAL